MKLIPHGLTPIVSPYGILSLIRFGRRRSPRIHSVLYLRRSFYEASPKAISRRTSYLRVRLEFHPYPQVIQTLFNVSWFGPPRCFTNASTCSWVDHPVSGLRLVTLRPFQTRFRYGFVSLTLLLNVTRRSVLQKVRHYSLVEL